MSVIQQVNGSVPEESRVRGVMELCVSRKICDSAGVGGRVCIRFFGGSLAVAWMEGSKFDPRKLRIVR